MKLFKTMLFFVLAALLVGSLATNTAAQSLVLGQVGGTVTDPAGAVVPNASVNLSSSETGFNEDTKTNADGEYHFALVKPGNYTVTVTMTGFATSKRSVIVAIGQASRVPIPLEVSGKVETIEITTAAPLLTT